MVSKLSRPVEVLGVLISLLVGIITLYFGATNPQIGIVFLVSIYFFIVIYLVVDYIMSLAKKKIDQINKNSENIESIRKELNELKKGLNLHLEIAKVKAKVESMEKSSGRKKGSIDPRIVIIIIILIFFYLYLRSLGILP